MGILGVDDSLYLAHERLGPVRDRHHELGRVIDEAQVVGGELTDDVDGCSDVARWFRLDEVAALHRVELVDLGLTMAGPSVRAPGTG